MERPTRPACLLAAALWLAGGAAAAPPQAAAPAGEFPLERFSGLFHGAILYVDGGTELEFLLEIAPTAGGELVGTLDMPVYDMKYQPLEKVRVDGREVTFSYRYHSEVRGDDALFVFEGELSQDGQRLVGTFLENRGRIPFRAERIGDAGSQRPEWDRPEVHDLGEGVEALRRAFNRRADHARLILLLSPT